MQCKLCLHRLHSTAPQPEEKDGLIVVTNAFLCLPLVHVVFIVILCPSTILGTASLVGVPLWPLTSPHKTSAEVFDTVIFVWHALGQQGSIHHTPRHPSWLYIIYFGQLFLFI